MWNHRIVRPLLVWDETDGLHSDALNSALEGRGAAGGLLEPTQEDFMARMDDELAISLAELQRRTEEYDSRLTTRPGVLGDALHAAARGYLDVLAVQQGSVSGPAPSAEIVIRH